MGRVHGDLSRKNFQSPNPKAKAELIMGNKELCDLIIAAYLEKHASKAIVTSFKKHADINEDNLDRYDKFLDILECSTKMAQLIDHDSSKNGEVQIYGKNQEKSSSNEDEDDDKVKKRKLSSHDTNQATGQSKRKKENVTTPKNSPFRRVESEKIQITNLALGTIRTRVSTPMGQRLTRISLSLRAKASVTKKPRRNG